MKDALGCATGANVGSGMGSNFCVCAFSVIGVTIGIGMGSNAGVDGLASFGGGREVEDEVEDADDEEAEEEEGGG